MKRRAHPPVAALLAAAILLPADASAGTLTSRAERAAWKYKLTAGETIHNVRCRPTGRRAITCHVRYTESKLPCTRRLIVRFRSTKPTVKSYRETCYATVEF